MDDCISSAMGRRWNVSDVFTDDSGGFLMAIEDFHNCTAAATTGRDLAATTASNVSGPPAYQFYRVSYANCIQGVAR